MDTQVNESFNNIAAWMAPKNKVYCGSPSLTNRLGIAIGIRSIGLLAYFKRLFIGLGIHMTPNVVHYLQVKDKSRFARIQKNKTKDQKKARLVQRFEKQKEDEAIAKKERTKRDGTYKSGQHVLNDGDEEQLGPRKKARKDLVCSSCGQTGHATTRSKVCLNYKVHAAPTSGPTAVTKPTVGYILTEDDQAEDVLNYETFGLGEQQDPSADDDEIELTGVAYARDNRLYDSDGEELYGVAPNPAAI
jgi:hypothetical protein